MGPTSTSVPWLAQNFCFLCVGGTAQDEEGGSQPGFLGVLNQMTSEVSSSLNYSVIWRP